jgi:hypothetical protein
MLQPRLRNSALAVACAWLLSVFPAPTARQLRTELDELRFRLHGIGGDGLVHLHSMVSSTALR